MRGITVGIPAFNARLTLERALDSALSQTVSEPVEIIVVDDGSTDTTANIARSYELMFPDVVRLIRCENRGVAAARNTIVENAKYDHLGPVDKVDSQISRSVIQDCFLGGSFGSRRPDRYGMADHRGVVAHRTRQEVPTVAR